MKLMEIIEPIKLLSGSHSDTGTTGKGCFMNVIAYLNGEPQITDQSTCVCYVVRPIAIWLNDYLKDGERARLIPFIERAMGSATEDKNEVMRRVNLAVVLAKTYAKYAAGHAAGYAAKYAGHTVEYAKYAAEYAAGHAAGHAAEYAKSAAEYAKYAKYAARRSAEYAKYAKYAAGHAARHPAEYAKYAGHAAGHAGHAAGRAGHAEHRHFITELAFSFLDSALPKREQIDPEIIERANKLLTLTA